MRAPQKDNNTYADKVMLRRTALSLLHDAPVIMETHGGLGDVYAAVYAHVTKGVVFEKDPSRTVQLALQRPSWSVYEADCNKAIAAGVGSHLTFNYLDIDPYGSIWATVEAFFGSKRPFAHRMVVVVNDGLRRSMGSSEGWKIHVLAPYVQKIGDHNVYNAYLEISEDLLKNFATQQHYTVTFFDGYHTGTLSRMTHWVAVLENDCLSDLRQG